MVHLNANEKLCSLHWLETVFSVLFWHADCSCYYPTYPLFPFYSLVLSFTLRFRGILCIMFLSGLSPLDQFFTYLQEVLISLEGPPWWLSCKEPAFQSRRHGRWECDLWVRKIPWRRAWQPAPIFLSGEFPRAEEPGVLQSMGSQESDDLATKQQQSLPVARF